MKRILERGRENHGLEPWESIMAMQERQVGFRDYVCNAASAQEAVIVHEERIEQWCAVTTQKGLKFPETDLDVFIPSCLLTVVPDFKNIAVLEYRREIGSWDNEYEPDLSLLVVDRGSMNQPSVDQEQGDEPWVLGMNANRQVALRKDLINPDDRILIMFMAHSPRSGQVEVLSYIDSYVIRGKGVSRAFQNNLYRIFLAIGVKFSYGTNTLRNIDFFLKTGSYSFDHLRKEKLLDGQAAFARYVQLGYTGSVRFYDRFLEEEYVKPEFLRLYDRSEQH